MLPDFIRNPPGTKKSLHISWKQSFLVTDAQGQTILRIFPGKLRHKNIHWKNRYSSTEENGTLSAEDAVYSLQTLQSEDDFIILTI